MYKNEVEQSRKDVHAHFGQEGGFQNIFPIPPFYKGFCVSLNSLIMSRCLHCILPRGCKAFGPGKF